MHGMRRVVYLRFILVILLGLLLSEPQFHLPTLIELTRWESGAVESAKIIRLQREQGSDLIDGVWWADLEEPIASPKEEPDSKWYWRDIVSHYQNKPAYKSVALQTDDGQVQAAMVYQIGFKSQVEDGKYSVYIDRLASAPRNRAKLTKQPIFQGSGTGLLVYAAAQSYFLGQQGRISLVPIANIDWYERRGFVRTDTEIPDGKIFELPKDRAIELLKKRGLLDE